MKRLAFIAVLSLSFISPFAFAYTGNELLRDFEGDSSHRNYASGYVDGMADVLDADKTICIPRVMFGQIHDVVKQFLRENPAERHQPAVILTLMALKKTWPCTGK